ncbi:unnamed protein product [Schistosoma turkestanicum]|nr:unnamed protein product [Schistosoma turkestanicum]
MMMMMMNTSEELLFHRIVRATIDLTSIDQQYHQPAQHQQSINWLVLCFSILIIVLTWLLNCILLGGALQTAGNGKNVSIVYFFIGSQAIGALLHVTLNLPLSIVTMLFGTTQFHAYIHIFCVYSIYLDTLFCNLAFLQTFFSSLDTCLRLHNPMQYLLSFNKKSMLWLKISSPWLMACLQSIGQLALSDHNQIAFYSNNFINRMIQSSPRSQQINNKWYPSSSIYSQFNMVCLLQDANFLIIRTVIAYGLPLITCLMLIMLQLCNLRRLRNYPPEWLHALFNIHHNENNNNNNNNNNNTSTTDYFTYYPQWHANMNDASLTSNSNYSLNPTITRETLLLPNNFQSIYRLEPINLPITSSISMYAYPKYDHIPIKTNCISENSETQTNNSSVAHISSSIEPLNTIEHHHCLPSSVAFHNPPPSSSPSLSHRHHHPLHSDAMTSEINNSKPTKKFHKSISDYQIKLENKNNSINRHFQRSYSLKTDTNPLVSSHQNQIIRHKNNFNQFIKTNLSLIIYQTEQLIVAINLISCILAIGIWSPYILATLIYGLCHQPNYNNIFSKTNYPGGNYADTDVSVNLFNPHSINRCFIYLSIHRLSDFHWWAYVCSGLLLPCLLFFLDLNLRQGCWNALQFNVKLNDNQNSKKLNNHTDNKVLNDNRNCKLNNQPSISSPMNNNNNIDYSLNIESNNNAFNDQQFQMTLITSQIHTD